MKRQNIIIAALVALVALPSVALVYATVDNYHSDKYHKLYDEIESKLPGAPIGFRNFDNDKVKQETKPTNRHRIGFV